MRTENKKLDDGFSQVAIWPGTTLEENQVEDFVAFFAGEGFRIQYLEEVITAPDQKDGVPVPDTGGRADQFFAVHEDDIGNFSVWRLQLGIRWIEDATSAVNGYPANPLYPERVLDYASWSAASDDAGQ
jgi:hypothetical protein